MTDNFISRKYRIVSSAIDLISESGLSALTTHNLAMKENTSEALMYKYFGSINEVLIEVVESYSNFDEGIRSTVRSKQTTYVNKLKEYFGAYATYYDNYYAIATIMLQYEELLHNIDTRERIASCIKKRMDFLEELFSGAINNGEIIDLFTPYELANNITGITMSHILSRRIEFRKKSFKQEFLDNINKWFDLLKVTN